MSALLAQLTSIPALLNNLYVADFFDVLIIAILIYFAIFLFKQTRSFYVAAGVGIVVALYAIAKGLNLFLTSIVFQAFFGVFLIALVVIFQEELRRFFEYLARWSTRQVRKSAPELTSPATTELLNAARQMAHDKTGALVVLKGKESVNSYVSGGRALDGLISEELLVSLFDSTTPGHDGAVIVQNGRVALFGGHLPLSHDYAQIGKRGTRHAAALGLSEVSDAFVIVISEERGAASYAHKGKLRTCKNIDELTGPLRSFLKENYPEESYTLWESLIRGNSAEKMVSFFLAAVLWFFFSFQAGTVQREFTVPVTYQNTADTLLIESAEPKELAVTLSARGSAAFDLLDIKTLAVAIDATRIATGTSELALTSDAVRRPPNFSVLNIEPQSVTVSARSVKVAELAVKPKLEGTPAAGFVIKSVTATPALVKALVPQAHTATGTIFTVSLDISGLRETKTMSALLQVPKDSRLKDLPDAAVQVRVEVVRK